MQSDLVASWKQLNSGWKCIPGFSELAPSHSIYVYGRGLKAWTHPHGTFSVCWQLEVWALRDDSVIEVEPPLPRQDLSPEILGALFYLPATMGRGDFLGPDLADTLIMEFPYSRAVWKLFLLFLSHPFCGGVSSLNPIKTSVKQNSRRATGIQHEQLISIVNEAQKFKNISNNINTTWS